MCVYEATVWRQNVLRFSQQQTAQGKLPTGCSSCDEWVHAGAWDEVYRFCLSSSPGCSRQRVDKWENMTMESFKANWFLAKGWTTKNIWKDSFPGESLARNWVKVVFLAPNSQQEFNILSRKCFFALSLGSCWQKAQKSWIIVIISNENFLSDYGAALQQELAPEHFTPSLLSRLRCLFDSLNFSLSFIRRVEIKARNDKINLVATIYLLICQSETVCWRWLTVKLSRLA